jgi:hypothetical protein
MKSKFLGTAAALALTAGVVLAGISPASAQHWGGWHGGSHGWNGGWHGGWRSGPGWPAAAAAGIVGGTIAAATSPVWAPGYYDYYQGGDYYPGYSYGPYGYNGGGYGYSGGYGNGYNGGYGYDNNYAFAPPPGASAPGGPVVAQGGNPAYCQQRYRSYDPSSGTFLGRDGQRHPCP